jgi:signal peptidase II
VFALAFVVALVVDLLSKTLAVRVLAPGRVVPAGTRSPVHLRRVDNRRETESRRTVAAYWLLTIVGSLLLTRTVFESSALAQVGLGLAAGGATGNVWDRLFGRAIVDFVELKGWPVFNFADAAITCGVALTLWTML